MSSTAVTGPDARDPKKWLGQTAWICALVLGLAGAGCSLFVDVNRTQCKRDADCATRGLSGVCAQGVCVAQSACGGEPGCALTARPPRMCNAERACVSGETCWRNQCLQSRELAPYVCPMPDATGTDKLEIDVHVEESASRRPPAGLVVSACRMADVTCDQPEARFEDPQSNGDVSLLVPPNFEGYLEARSDSTVPQLSYLGQPIVVATSLEPLSLLTPQMFEMSVRAVGAPGSLDNGVVMLETLDCAGNAVGGLHYETTQADSFPFFVINGVPSDGSDVSVIDPKTNGAIGGFANVQPGVVRVVVRIGTDGPVLDQLEVSVRAGSITQVEIRPGAG
jgi:hypothetical protein